MCVSFSLHSQVRLTSLAAVIDKTASFVANSANPPQFEDKIREGQRSDPKFSFLNPADPYHGYYRHKMDRIFQGEADEEASPEKAQADAAPGSELKPIDVGIEAPPSVFIADMPNINALDLCVALAFIFTIYR